MLNSVPGLRVFLQNPPPIRIGAQFTRSMYQMTLQSQNTATLYKYAPMLEAKMRQLPDLRGVNSDLQVENPQVNVDIDRDKAHSLGVSANAIEDALYDAYGSRQISTIYAPNDEYWVIMEVEPQYQADPGTLSLLYVRSSSGALVPLDTLVKFTRSLGPLQVNHSGQLPSATISFNVAPGVSLGKALAEVNKLAAATLPDSITTSFQGTAQAFEASLTGLGVLLMMTILVIYLVLGVLYESFIHPITILSGLPSAGFGALVTLWLFGMELDLFAFVGVIMLVGLVKKNAIMMIDFALDAQRTEGKSPAEAIFEGCIIRFRPIMMTTMAALMGTLAYRDRTGRRRFVAPSARCGSCRRLVLLAVPDALHNAGVLHLHGSVPRTLQRMARRPPDNARDSSQQPPNSRQVQMPNPQTAASHHRHRHHRAIGSAHLMLKIRNRLLSSSSTINCFPTRDIPNGKLSACAVGVGLLLCTKSG